MRTLLTFPHWVENPYLQMLYLGVLADGWQLRGAVTLDALETELAALAAGDIVHLQWTSPICENQSDAATAAVAFQRFGAAVDAALDRGVRLLWTVHNLLAHDARYPDLEVRLAQFLADRSSRIVQLNPHTAAAARGLYDLPGDKLVTLRHASYLGIYAPPPSALQARRFLNVPAAAPTVGFVGRIRPYKGVETLLAAVDRATNSIPDLTLLLAGRTDPDHRRELEALLPGSVRAVRHHRHVPDGDLGTWFAASSVMAFPYQRVLNSGSLLLAATFGRPCILPAEPHLVDAYGDQAWISFFEPGPDAVASLAEAIVTALRQPPTPRQAAARAFAAEYTTHDMTADFVAIVDSLPYPEASLR